ncbi:dihydrofolate reductase [Bartonella krasnovii]|uniref:Dihydrofolate reductase n=1 Tax=Bartonella krasnovii TaxID=2267275 RepID=A0A5B9D1L4_9HYPH|nr:dihydrofolate reductase [Bartonella krasnovii]QEE12446.1 dihydrofolate reductase [Bartonella krasnovii]UNF28541.1 dihydrofolate reductase [Bartonella krasnovii]UNF34919.1 dihydrofolate reductase [Bartonella krasnovii]UNF36556.1 dihydrofolate reductase [Bartonella krasnovii]UNF38189.1 dihydrofolate reductase [Bartonella krasnovii]
MKISICLIAAVAENGVIGCKGAMPWHLSTDLQRFKALTLGKPIIMGRKTWDSIGRPLPRRTNIVITRDCTFSAEGAVVAHSLSQACSLATNAASQNDIEEIFIIGGGEIFKQAFDLADKIFLTEVLDSIEGDSFFPIFDKEKWTIVQTQDIPKGDKDSHPTRFVVYERK